MSKNRPLSITKINLNTASREELISYIKKLEKELMNMKDTILCWYAQNEWIPVSERLPKLDGEYEVTRAEYVPSSAEADPHWELVVDMAKFEGNYNRENDLENHNNGFNKMYHVYAWRNKPEPYKKEGE